MFNQKLETWNIKMRNFINENLMKFKDCLKSISFSDVYLIKDPNVAYKNFFELFQLFYNLCFPITFKKRKLIMNPNWLTLGNRRCSQIIKRLMLWHHRLNPSKVNVTKLKSYSNRLKKIIKLTLIDTKNYYKIETYNKSKMTWKIINGNRSVFLPKK